MTLHTVSTREVRVGESTMRDDHRPINWAKGYDVLLCALS
jgi:hypothetical protein